MTFGDNREDKFYHGLSSAIVSSIVLCCIIYYFNRKGSCFDDPNDDREQIYRLAGVTDEEKEIISEDIAKQREKEKKPRSKAEAKRHKAEKKRLRKEKQEAYEANWVNDDSNIDPSVIAEGFHAS